MRREESITSTVAPTAALPIKPVDKHLIATATIKTDLPVPRTTARASVSIEEEIWRVFGTRTAVAVARAESGLNPTIVNRIGCCVGVFQIHRYAHANQIPGATMIEKTAWLQNPSNNIAFAKTMHDASGWQPWEAYTSKAYLKYLQ